MDAVQLTGADMEIQNEAMRDHLRHLRRLFPRETFVLIVETNMAASVANVIIKVAREFGPCRALSTQQGYEGVCTSMESKDMYIRYGYSVLSSKYIHVMSEFVCRGRSAWEPDRTYDGPKIRGRIFKQLIDELRRITFSVKEAKDEFGKAKRSWTGKGGGKKDDLAFTFLQGIYWMFSDSRK